MDAPRTSKALRGINRRARHRMIPCYLIYLAWLIGLFTSSSLLSHLESWMWTSLNLVALSILAFALTRGVVDLRKFRGKVTELNGKICPWCSYELTGLPEDGQCPECSKPYRGAELMTYWKRQAGIRESAPVRVRDVVMVLASFVPAAGLCVLFAFHMLTEWMLPGIYWVMIGLIAICLPVLVISLPSGGRRRVDSVK